MLDFKLDKADWSRGIADYFCAGLIISWNMAFLDIFGHIHFVTETRRHREYTEGDVGYSMLYLPR